MSWKVPYVVFRHQGNGNFDEVFQTRDFKKAKYWLTYIAEIGDVLCRTNNHPKYSKGDGLPEYFSHKISSGSITNSCDEYTSSYLNGVPYIFPAFPDKEPEDYI